MKKIIINEEKCNGCGKCVTHCQKGGLRIVNGKAKLTADFYCGAFTECIGGCPQGAITVTNEMQEKKSDLAGGCYFSGRYNSNWKKEKV